MTARRIRSDRRDDDGMVAVCTRSQQGVVCEKVIFVSNTCSACSFEVAFRDRRNSENEM